MRGEQPGSLFQVGTIHAGMGVQGVQTGHPRFNPSSGPEPGPARVLDHTDLVTTHTQLDNLKQVKLVLNKITSFPHTLSLCSKKAESKVKRVKSYYCTRVCQNMPNAQTYMYGVPKLFTPPDSRCTSGIEDRHNFHFKHSFQPQSTHTAATRSMYTRRYAQVHTQALCSLGR